MHNIYIQIRRKTLTRSIMMISNLKNPLISRAYTHILERCKGQLAVSGVLMNQWRLWNSWICGMDKHHPLLMGATLDLYHSIVTTGSRSDNGDLAPLEAERSPIGTYSKYLCCRPLLFAALYINSTYVYIFKIKFSRKLLFYSNRYPSFGVKM